MSTITLKRHDTAKTISDTLLVDGDPVNLTGASVALILRAGEAEPIRKVATIEDELLGTVSYAITPEDSANSGQWAMEWEVTLSGGTILTFPDDSYHTLKIINDLG